MVDIINMFGEKTPDCAVGVLVAEDVRAGAAGGLKAVKAELEARIREKYGETPRSALKALHPLDTYVAYYKKYGYTYHVLQQLESIAKGKPIPDALPLVLAMFMAELDNLLLTAGHDLDRLAPPLRLEISTGAEGFVTMGGKEVSTVPGDFMISDGEAVVSSILRGPDGRTAISAETSRAVYTVYAPAGVERPLLEKHLGDIEGYIRLASDGAARFEAQIF